MPFLGLVITSLGFLVPTWVALKCKKKGLAWNYKCITITSVLYHGTQKAVFQLLDRAVVHSISAFHLGHGLIKAVRRPSIPKCMSLISTGVPLYLFYGKSARTTGIESSLWHMLFHVSGQGVLSLYAIYF